MANDKVGGPEGGSLNRIRDLRATRLWTQEQLAHEAGVSTWTVQRAETGKLTPNVVTQEKIARALGVDRHIVFPPEPAEASA